VTLNNIYSNSTTGTNTYDGINPSSVLTASVTCCSSAGTTSSLWTAPTGTTVRRVRLTYSESDNSTNYVSGYLINGADNSIIQTFNTSFTGWVVLPANITSLRVRVRDSGWGSATDSITVNIAEVTKLGAADVAAAVNSSVDMRRNYLGTWPNVMNRVSESSMNSLDVQGFVGAPFTSAWDTGIYKSGDVSGTWSGTVYVTGNTTIPAGDVLNVSAGTQVLFINHDQNLNLEGDFSLTAAGQFNLNGAQGNPVLIAGFGPSDVDMFQTINLNGTAANASTWNDVTLRNAKNGITLRGPSTLTRVNVTTVGNDGVQILSGTGATLNSVTVDGAVRYGIYVTNATPTLNRLMVRNNLSHGIYYSSGNGGTLEDSTVRDNQGNGIHVIGSSAPALNYNLITYNAGAGIRVANNSNVTGTHNVIKFNDDAGITLLSSATQHPSATFNYSNIYGNAVLGTTIAASHDPSSVLTASVTCCSSAGTTSSIYTVPDGREARLVRVVYSESDNSTNYVSGFVIDGATNTILHTLNTSTTTWLNIPAGVTQLRVRVRDSGWGSATDSITITDLLTGEYSTATAYELSSMTVSGTSDAKFNYWTPTIGEVPTKIHQARNGSVDFTGFTGAEYPSGTVTQVGPRP